MNLTQTGLRLAKARAIVRAATVAARTAASEAAAAGTPETVIARELGVTRMTVRAWLARQRQDANNS